MSGASRGVGHDGSPAAGRGVGHGGPPAASGAVGVFATIPAMRRLVSALVVLFATMLVLAPAALASNDGRGFYGASDDKVVTKAGFILIIFFPMFVFVMSTIQGRLEKRKEARHAADISHADARYRGGW
jgi:hypothetical protein